MRIGYSRREKHTEHAGEKYCRAGEIVTSAGLGLMAALLIGCMTADVTQRPADDAVYVMSMSVESVAETGVNSADSREEILMPEKSTSAEAEVSFFEIIGEFFAEMIFGEG